MCPLSHALYLLVLRKSLLVVVDNYFVGSAGSGSDDYSAGSAGSGLDPTRDEVITSSEFD